MSKTVAADAMRRAIEGFVARLPSRVVEIISLAAAREFEKLRVLVHQLKGSGSGYGFPSITRTAAKTEAVIKSGADFEAVGSAVEELIALIRSTPGYDVGKEREAIHG